MTSAEFWAKVDKHGPNGCWLWTGTKMWFGYGVAYIGGKVHNAHRAAWILTKGDPGKLNVCHKCDNPPCVRPSHMFLGTDKDNHADSAAKGRRANGERNNKAKLTKAQVKQIRLRYSLGEKSPQLSRVFGVTKTNICYIVRGITWRHV